MSWKNPGKVLARTYGTKSVFLRMSIVNILRGLPCRLESLRLKFTNEPSIFVDGDLAESIKRCASDRQGGFFFSSFFLSFTFFTNQEPFLKQDLLTSVVGQVHILE